MSRDTDRVVVSKLDRTWTSSTFDVARLEATDAEAAGAHSAAMLATTPTATPPRMARPPECSLARSGELCHTGRSGSSAAEKTRSYSS
jgi:hypothetical protein